MRSVKQVPTTRTESVVYANSLIVMGGREIWTDHWLSAESWQVMTPRGAAAHCCPSDVAYPLTRDGLLHGRLSCATSRRFCSIADLHLGADASPWGSYTVSHSLHAMTENEDKDEETLRYLSGFGENNVLGHQLA